MVLSLADAIRLVKDVTLILKAEETLVRADVDKVVVVGDLHGQFYDLLRIFELAGQPSEENMYMFNGDFVDRGSNSLEVIFTLFALKLQFPKAIFLNRGNHEAQALNLRYGFASEIRERYGMPGKELFDAFSEAFRWLPLAHVCLWFMVGFPALIHVCNSRIKVVGAPATNRFPWMLLGDQLDAKVLGSLYLCWDTILIMSLCLLVRMN